MKHHISLTILLLAGVGCSKSNGIDSQSSPSKKSAAENRLIVISDRLDTFEQIFGEYKKCVIEKGEDECTDLANQLNDFSFGSNN